MRNSAKAKKPTRRKRGITSPRVLELQRRELRQRLQGLIEMSSDFYWEQDATHRFTLVSGPMFAKTGIDPQNLIGKAHWELNSVAPVNDGGRWDTFKAALDAHAPVDEFLYKYLNPRGELRYVSTTGRPMFDADGRFKGYRGTSQDVTPRVQLTRRLAIEQDVARVLAEASTVDDAANRILRKICEILGWWCGAWWEYDDETHTLRCVQTWGIDAPGVAAFLAATRRLSPLMSGDHGLVRQACAGRQPVWIRNVTKERSFLRAPAAAKASLRSAFAFPIKAGDKVIGAMEFFSGESPHETDPELLAGAVYVGSSMGQFCQRKQAEEDLLRFRAAMDMSGDPIYLVDRASMRFVDVNETASRRMGYTRAEMLKMGPHDLLVDDRKELERIYDEVIAAGSAGITTETHARSKDGRQSIAELHRRALRVGEKWIIVSIARDITLRKRAEEATKRLGRMLAALSATNEAIIHSTTPEALYQQVCDAGVHGGGFITAAVIVLDSETSSANVAAMTGLGTGVRRLREVRISMDAATPEGQGLVGNAFRTLKPCVSNDFLKDERTRPWHAQAQKGGIAAGAAVPLTRHGVAMGVLLFYSGDKYAFDDEIVRLLERLAENVAFALDNFERESERRHAQERIQYMATHDSLTELPNRVLFHQLLGVALQSARRYDRKFAVLFIDLDRFKVINDTLGHEAGDTLLQEVTARFKQTLRASDVIARLGGDEFIVLAQEANDKDQAAAVARKLLSATLQPMVLMGQECRVTASIGIAMFPGDGDDGRALMKNADIAMYLAKEEGKNNFQFYVADMKPQSLERLTLEAHLRRALDQNELFLHYQAKRDLRTGAITGVEALLRWHSPALGVISPAQAISLAEETGLIVPIGRWVLRTACAQNVAWQRQGLPPVCVAVNLSSRQFADENLLYDITVALAETGLAPERLELELTESMVVHDPERALKTVAAIKELGVRLAIDDFGTGYSSLAHLKRFPIDTLKVDRSFIRDIPQDPEDKAITKAIIAMGKTLGLTVVAEGVETRAQEDFLRAHGCDEMQGYYFSKPVAPDAFAELLRAHTPLLSN